MLPKTSTHLTAWSTSVLQVRAALHDLFAFTTSICMPVEVLYLYILYGACTCIDGVCNYVHNSCTHIYLEQLYTACAHTTRA